MRPPRPLDDFVKAAGLAQKFRDDWATLRRLFGAQVTFVQFWQGLTEAGMDEDEAAKICRALHDDYEAQA